MAFQHPAPATSRPRTAETAEQLRTNSSTSFAQDQAYDDSREWVLFPSTRFSDTADEAEPTYSQRTPETAGPSRLSDLSSLRTIPQSSVYAGNVEKSSDRSSGGREEEVDHELDSLDEGLHAFQTYEPPQLRSSHFQTNSSVFPRHDGLGTFPASTPGVEEVPSWDLHQDLGMTKKRPFDDQEHQRSTTRETPHGPEEDQHEALPLDRERRERIEQWRLNHSRILLNEIEKELKEANKGASRYETPPSAQGVELRHSHKLLQVGDEAQWGHEDQDKCEEPISNDRGETIWERITHKVIHDLIGIDDQLLSIILGDSLPPEEDDTADTAPLAKAPRLHKSSSHTGSVSEQSWERKFLARIARELGQLVQFLSIQPTSPSISIPVEAASIEYAGIPVTHITQPTSSRTQPQPKISHSQAKAIARPTLIETTTSDSPSITFHPTLPQHFELSHAHESSSNAVFWGIEDEHQDHKKVEAADAAAVTVSQEEFDDWSSSPDLKTVFQRFLSTRFGSFEGHHPHPNVKRTTTSSSTVQKSTGPVTAISSETLRRRRAAIIRQYHPLTTTGTSTINHLRNLNHHRHGSSSLHSHRNPQRRHASWLLRGRAGSTNSCASESNDIIATSSMSTRSRNYWDVGGVFGGGGWGEV